MKRIELVNHIKGSYLKKEYLEAFLVQGAYIEGLLKLVADYHYWKEVSDKIIAGNRIIKELRQRIKRFNLNELIDFLFKCGIINQNQKQELHQYREKRNDVLHDLVRKISKEEFDKELRSACELGDKIISDDKFKEIEEFLDFIDEDTEKDNTKHIPTQKTPLTQSPTDPVNLTPRTTPEKPLS